MTCAVCTEQEVYANGRCLTCFLKFCRAAEGGTHTATYTPRATVAPSGSFSRREAARLGGLAVVADRGSAWMAEIGKRGGLAISRNRYHMAFIGSRGGRRARQRERGQ